MPPHRLTWPPYLRAFAKRRHADASGRPRTVPGSKKTRSTSATWEAAMFGKKAALVGLATTGLVVSAVGVASADAGSGFTSMLIARGESGHSFNIHQRKGN